MLNWFRRNDPQVARAHELYGSIVAAARAPALYRDLRVPDTMAGRFEMVVLHVFLLLERLRRDGEAGQRLGQLVVEAMFEALDDDMRELGVSDMTVPRKMHKAAGAFHGRCEAYRAAFAAVDTSVLTATLARNVHGDEDAATATALAAYVRRRAAALAAASDVAGALSTAGAS